MDKEFYINNEVKIDEDFTSSHPHYYSSLRNAFDCYFETFLDLKDSIRFLVDFNWKRKDIGFNFSISYDKIVTIILEFHRFFELFIKDLLNRVDPFLSLRAKAKANEFIDNFILGGSSYTEFKKIEFGETNLRDIRTIEFGEAKKRLGALIKKISDESEHAFLNKFLFLTDESSGLEDLSWWRNRLAHNGKNIPNIISLDYLVSQKIIPLISRIIDTDFEVTGNNITPPYFETATGINIVKRITQIRFTQSDVSLSKEKRYSTEIAKKFIELYHLKGLGRAAMNYNKYLGINFKTYIEYHRLKHKDSHKLVSFQEQDPNYLKTVNCLCCGNLTLVTYKEIYYSEIEERDLDLIWSRCLVCDYGVSNKLGNPKNYGITDKDIFDEKK